MLTSSNNSTTQRLFISSTTFGQIEKALLRAEKLAEETQDIIDSLKNGAEANIVISRMIKLQKTNLNVKNSVREILPVSMAAVS